MFELSSLLIFIAAASALIIVPGPAVTFIVARSIEHGRFLGFVSVLGVMTGSLIHILLTALGLSALLLQSTIAFSVVKYLGAAYLVYLGIKSLLSEPVSLESIQTEHTRPLRIYWQGFIVNVFNPKGVLFFVAFLPQFVNPNLGNPTVQIVTLGLIFIGVAIISDSIYVLLASAARNFLSGNLKMAAFQKNFAGLIYILLGLTTAVTGQQK